MESSKVQIGKRYLVQLKGYQPVGEVLRKAWGGEKNMELRFIVLMGIVTLAVKAEQLSEWCGETY